MVRNYTRMFTVCVASLSLLFGIPLGASSNNDGNLSRTFLTNMSIDWSPHSEGDGSMGGVGWYDPNSSNRGGDCMNSFWGVFLGGDSYYQSLRIAFSVSADIIPEAWVGLNCDSSDQYIGTSNATIRGSSIYQSSLVCLKTFSVCSIDRNTARWQLFSCDNINDSNFVAGDILGLSSLNSVLPTIGSSMFEYESCDQDILRHEVTAYLSPLLGYMASTIPGVPLDLLLGSNHANTYMISCFDIEYNKFPLGSSEVNPKTARSHDYFLALTEGDFINWEAAILYHHNQPNSNDQNEKKYPNGSNSVANQGYYDLSGDNDCPYQMY